MVENERAPQLKYPYLKKAENGYYYAFYYDISGNRQRKSLKTRNQVVANRKFNQILEEVDRGILGFSISPKKLPFEQIVKKYLSEGTHDLASTTLDRHESAFNVHLIPHFKKTSLKAITPKVVLKYIRKRQKKAAPNTIHKELAALYFAFRNSPGHVLFDWQAGEKLTVRTKKGEVFFYPDRFAVIESRGKTYRCFFELERNRKNTKERAKKLRRYRAAIRQRVLPSSSLVFFITDTVSARNDYYDIARRENVQDNIYFGVLDEVLENPSNVDYLYVKAA